MKHKLFIIPLLSFIFLGAVDDMTTADRGGGGGGHSGGGGGHGGGGHSDGGGHGGGGHSDGGGRGGGGHGGGGHSDGGGRGGGGHSDGGGHGGGGHGGSSGGARLGNNSARSPSMSRIEGKAGRPSPQGKPSQQARSKSGRVQQPINAGSRNQFQNAFKRSPPIQINQKTTVQNQFKNSFSTRVRNNREASKRVHGFVARSHPHFNNWFNNNFFERHNFRPLCFNDRANWWGCPGWGSLCNWLPWGWNSPYYYDNDSGYYYLLSQEFGANAPQSETQQQESNQQPQIQQQQQQTSPQQQINIQNYQVSQSDWLPLGVFAVGKNEVIAGFSNMFIQLAVDKQGDISGTYYNAMTDETQPIEGSVDKDTQQVVWKLTDSPNSPLVMTGMYNLTQDKVDVQVQFQDGTVQTWVLVRLNN